MQLTQKESGLLKDLKSQEKLCIEKYKKHAECASDVQLKDLFGRIAQVEQGHYDTISQMEMGSVPQVSSSSKQQMPTFKSVYGTTEDERKKNDCYLCADLLATEKHVAHLYDTSIFEFSDEGARSVLNHIEKEEQGHGKMIYDYMSANNMYS